LLLWSQPPARPHTAAVVGKSARYCNPLPLEATSRDGSPQGVSLGDVAVVREGGLYYLFGSGGGAWVSSDLVNWIGRTGKEILAVQQVKVVARNGIEPPTPAFSGRLTDTAKWFASNAS
jgi:hypothetical protein